MMTNYYLVLGISPESSLSQIQRAFRTLCHQYHPDRSSGEPQRFLLLKEAYDTLRNPVERQRHDTELAQEQPPPPPAPRVVAQSPIDLFTDFEGHAPSAEEILDVFLQNFTHRHESKARHLKDLNIQIMLTPEEAQNGGVLPLSVPLIEPCALCEGTGRMGFLLCEGCGGKGSAQINAPVDIVIPHNVADGTTLPVSLSHLGIRNLYLNLQIRVASGPSYA
jgi:molecular chaperone DnaJ